MTECVVAYFDRATSELAHEARHDQLTGLLHHQAFVRELELELERARRYGHGVSLVFLDLDRFKEINDTLGHPAGDRVLQRLGAAAARIRCAAPTSPGGWAATSSPRTSSRPTRRPAGGWSPA